MKFSSINERNKFIENNLRLVAKRVQARNKGSYNEDLFQAGSLGLVDATDRFDESRGVTFSTYAVRYIDGYILKWKAFDTIIRPLRRKTAEGRLQYKEIGSIDALINDNKKRVGDLLCGCDDLEQNVVGECFAAAFLGVLKPRDREIIVSKMNGITQRKISKKIGISQTQVCRIIKNVGEQYLRYEKRTMR